MNAAYLQSRRRRRWGAAAATLLSRAVAYHKVSEYGGSGALLDLSGNGHDAQFGSTVGADSNDPLYLAHDGTDYAYFPGLAGNYASTPDSAAVSITGDLDLRIRTALGNVDVVQGALIQKEEAGQFSYRFMVASGQLGLYLSQDGSTVLPGAFSGTSLSAAGFVNGQKFWKRATWRQSDGRVQFFTSAEDVENSEDVTNWTQLGADKTIAIASIFDGSATLYLGTNGSYLHEHSLYRAQVYAGLAGSDLRADFDPSRSAEPHASFVAATGETWTLNRAASGRKLALVDRPILLLGTDDYLEIADHADLDFGAGQDATVLVAFRRFGTPSGFGVYIGNATLADVDRGWAIYHNSTPAYAAFISDGVSSTDTGNAPTDGEATVFAMRREAGTSLELLTDGVSAGSTASSVGDSSSANAVRIGRSGGGAIYYLDMEFLAAAVFREALTDAEIAQAGEELLTA